MNHSLKISNRWGDKKKCGSGLIHRVLLSVAIVVGFLVLISLLNNHVEQEKDTISERGTEKKKQILVMTSYFSAQPDPQRDSLIPKDSMEYIRPLYESAMEFHIPVVIFHDGLSEGFIESFPSELVEFHKVNTRKSMSVNDERFLFYQEFLSSREIGKEYEFVVLADVSDVYFLSDPFPSFSSNQNQCSLWVAREHSKIKQVNWMFEECYDPRSNFVNKHLDLSSMLFNAGVVAGATKQIQSFLEGVVQEFARMGLKSNVNCNMAAIQYVLQNKFSPDELCSNLVCWKDKCTPEGVVHHKPLLS